MADILIKGMEMPKDCPVCPLAHWNKLDMLTGCELGHRYVSKSDVDYWQSDVRPDWCPLVEVPTHGRLIDADRLHESMYHRVFETDGDTMWQSGCWVRYRAIEQVQDSAPTVIEASEDGEQDGKL